MNTKDITSRLNEAKNIIEDCMTALSKAGKELRRKTPPPTRRSFVPTKLKFDLNERNFIKTYAKGLSGPKKFTLLVSHITKGKIGIEVELKIARSKWNKMSAKNLMGYEFNLKYPNEAKTRGWIDSKKNGTYHLRSNWMEIFD